MNNREFDKLIKSKLNMAGIKGTPDWTEMESRIDEWELKEGLMSDSEFDKMIANRLTGLKAGNRKQSWLKLEKRIFDQTSLGLSVIYYQLAGAASIILLMLLLFQLSPANKTFYKADFVVADELGKSPEPGQQESELNSFNTIALAETESINNDPDESIPIIMEEKTSDDTKNVTDGSLSSSGQDRLAGSVGIPNQTKHTSVVIALASDQDSSDNFSSDIPIGELNLGEDVVLDTRASGREQLASLASLVPKKVFLLSPGNDKVRIEQSPFQSYVQFKPKKEIVSRGFRIEGFVIPQFTLIHSPFDDIMQAPGYRKSKLNLGIGMAAGYRIKNFEFNVGFAYDQLSYSPRITTEYVPDNKSEIYLAGISTELLSIPLHLKYHFKNSGRLGIYGLTGMTIALPLQTDYDVEVKEDNGLAYLIEDLKTHPAYHNTLINQKDFEKGLLDGGDPSTSIAVNYDAGIGLEYTLDKDWLFFIESGFSYDFRKDGLGPNHDKFHRFSLRTGIAGSIN